jgi:hypothetical protein
MAVAKKRPKPKGGTQIGTIDENSTPSEVLAHEILLECSDLAPSISRITDSDLGESGSHHAVTAFQGSLGTIGDPMRNPADAIEAARKYDTTS